MGCNNSYCEEALAAAAGHEIAQHYDRATAAAKMTVKLLGAGGSSDAGGGALQGVVAADAEDLQGCTPLHAAASQGQLEVVRYLAAGGAVVSRADTEGGTPLHAAALGGHLGVVRWLADKGGGGVLAARNERGWRALHCAAFWGRLDVVQWLVLEGAQSPDDVDGRGNTALHMAAYGGRPAVVIWLVETAGAEMRCRNVEALTAMQVAARGKFMNMMHFLVAAESRLQASRIASRISRS